MPSQPYDRRKRRDLVSLGNVKSEEQAQVSGGRLFHARAAIVELGQFKQIFNTFLFYILKLLKHNQKFFVIYFRRFNLYQRPPSAEAGTSSSTNRSWY